MPVVCTSSLLLKSIAQTAARMSFAADDASPVSSLPSSPSLSAGDDAATLSSTASSQDSLLEYRAPLNGEAPEPSIDGTSVMGGEGGIRAESADQVSDDDKQVSQLSGDPPCCPDPRATSRKLCSAGSESRGG